MEALLIESLAHCARLPSEDGGGQLSCLSLSLIVLVVGRAREEGRGGGRCSCVYADVVCI